MTKAIESCIEEAVKRGAVSETYGGAALEELRELRYAAQHVDAQRAHVEG